MQWIVKTYDKLFVNMFGNRKIFIDPNNNKIVISISIRVIDYSFFFIIKFFTYKNL